MDEFIKLLLKSLFDVQVSLNGQGEICIDTSEGETCQTAFEWLASIVAITKITDERIRQCVIQRHNSWKKIQNIALKQAKDSICWLTTAIMLKRYHDSGYYKDENTLIAFHSNDNGWSHFVYLFHNNAALPNKEIVSWFQSKMGLKVLNVYSSAFGLSDFTETLLRKGPMIILMPIEISSEDLVKFETLIRNKKVSVGKLHYVLFYGIYVDNDGKIWCEYWDTFTGEDGIIKWDTLDSWIKYYREQVGDLRLVPVVIYEKKGLTNQE